MNEKLVYTKLKLLKDAVLELAIEQLVRLFGSSAKNASSILYKDWAGESETATMEDLEPLRYFQSYGPPPKAGVWKNKVAFAGTEMSSQFGGNLEGALHSAEQVVAKLLENWDRT